MYVCVCNPQTCTLSKERCRSLPVRTPSKARVHCRRFCRSSPATCGCSVDAHVFLTVINYTVHAGMHACKSRARKYLHTPVIYMMYFLYVYTYAETHFNLDVRNAAQFAVLLQVFAMHAQVVFPGRRSSKQKSESLVCSTASMPQRARSRQVFRARWHRFVLTLVHVGDARATAAGHGRDHLSGSGFGEHVKSFLKRLRT